MRFALDYETFQRVKVTERVSFPVTLNLNEYMKGYEGIETKLYDKEVERMKEYQSGAIEKNLKDENQKKKKLMDMQKQREGQTDGTVQDAEVDVLAKTPEPRTAGEPNAEELEFLEADELMKKHEDTQAKTNESGVKIAVGAAKDVEMTEDEVRDVPDSENPYLYAV